MGKGDKSRKMRQRARQAKKKGRIRRRLSAVMGKRRKSK